MSDSLSVLDTPVANAAPPSRYDLETSGEPVPIASSVSNINTNPTSILAQNLTRDYEKFRAVDNISLNIREGEFFGVLGPNGAGKSTTIKMLCGMLKPTFGSVQVAGFDVQAQPIEVKARIGVLPEETNLYERLTGEEFLFFAGRMYGLPRDEAKRRAASLLDLMELGTDDRKKMIVDYSMGMKKKVALASALIHSPRVLFLDEPFNGIDPISVRALRSVLRHLTEDRGTTIVFSSHVMEVVERLCSRVAIINKGQIVGEGTIPQLREQAQAGGNSSLEDIFLHFVATPKDEESLSWL